MEETISIIIPAWNEQKVIEESAIFLRKLNLPFKHSELIFIAGGEDDTFNICNKLSLSNFSTVIALKQDSKDFKSGALIKGINKSKGDYIILIDADTIVPSNLIIEVVKSLQKFDAVSCDYLPRIQKGFWHSYYNLNKLIWSCNPRNLSTLFGAATISLKRNVVDEIGVKNFFTDKSRAGVDYYMSLILKKYKKKLGFVKNTRVITARPRDIKSFSKDQKRWMSAFYEIHKDDKFLLLNETVLNTVSLLCPMILFLFNTKDLMKVSEKNYSKLRFGLILFFINYLKSFIAVSTLIKKIAGKLKSIGHFKGFRQ